MSDGTNKLACSWSQMMGTWRPLIPTKKIMNVSKNLNKGAVQTIRSARPHRKQPGPGARVPGTRLLGRLDLLLGLE